MGANVGDAPLSHNGTTRTWQFRIQFVHVITPEVR
jgi:hypothetical protein